MEIEITQEMLDTIERVVGRLASKFKFGYHELEDMKQQGRLIAIKALNKYDTSKPLENFLWSAVHNGLYNFKRDNYFRPEKPCDKCPLYINSACTKFSNNLDCELYSKWVDRTEKRKALMSTVEEAHSYYEEHTIEDAIHNKNIFDMVDRAMPIELREYWIRFIHNLKLNKIKREQVLLEIQLILEDNKIEP